MNSDAVLIDRAIAAYERYARRNGIIWQVPSAAASEVIDGHILVGNQHQLLAVYRAGRMRLVRLSQEQVDEFAATQPFSEMRLPPAVPLDPEKAYPEDWKGWDDFLGKGPPTDRDLIEWANRNRRLHREGKLSAAKIAKLEKLPNWTWEDQPLPPK